MCNLPVWWSRLWNVSWCSSSFCGRRGKSSLPVETQTWHSSVSSNTVHILLAERTSLDFICDIFNKFLLNITIKNDVQVIQWLVGTHLRPIILNALKPESPKTALRVCWAIVFIKWCTCVVLDVVRLWADVLVVSLTWSSGFSAAVLLYAAAGSVAPAD